MKHSHFGKLASLIVEKNNLNRERKRFFHIMNDIRLGKVTYCFTLAEAEKGYKQSVSEMKVLTPLIREASKEAGVVCQYDANWCIVSVAWGKAYPYYHIRLDEIERIAHDYEVMLEVDEILLG